MRGSAGARRELREEEAGSAQCFATLLAEQLLHECHGRLLVLASLDDCDLVLDRRLRPFGSSATREQSSAYSLIAPVSKVAELELRLS